ncbi:MAG: UDP-2,3-diacylglucosamine diphosphatase [Planctomycetota bacterium]
MQQTRPRFSKALFLSDVHLASEKQGQSFAVFLNQLLGAYSHLCILGDLFDYWLGPRSEKFPAFQPVLIALKRLTDSGMIVSFIHGNRDFLLEDSFQKKYGVRIYSHFQKIRFAHCQILLTHGDLLCTSDHKYQFYRRIIRSTSVRIIAASLPLDWIHLVALKLKKTSKKSISYKSKRHLALNLNYARELLDDSDVVICGHVHQEMEYCLQENPQKKFFVLGSWETRGCAIEYDGCSFRVLHPELALNG